MRGKVCARPGPMPASDEPPSWADLVGGSAAAFALWPSLPPRPPRTLSSTASSAKELCAAVLAGDSASVRAHLADPNVNPNGTDPNGWTPLMIAACRKAPDMVDLLLADPRVDPNLVADNFARVSAFHAACLYDATGEVVRRLLADPRLDPNVLGSEGIPGFIVACYARRTNVVKVLLEHAGRVDIWARCPMGLCALDYSDEATRALVEAHWARMPAPARRGSSLQQPGSSLQQASPAEQLRLESELRRRQAAEEEESLRRRLDEEERALRRRLEIENEARASEIAMLAERLRLEKEIDGLQRARGTQQQPDRPAALRSSYEIDPADLVQGKFLGAGSFGTVFEGTYQNHTRVAMKVVRIAGSSKNADRKRAEFVHEMAVWGSLPYHDNVLPLIGWCRKPVCMVTRLMEGTAAEYLERHAWDRRLTLDLLFQVAKGMNHLHSRPSPILHSDLKAANVLVDENGTAKVSDFGQSKVRRAATGGSVFMGGTPPFMAPEVWKGTRSRASDVYAFAMLAHELWSKGDLPFDDCGLGLHEFGERIAADPGFRPGRPDGCPEALWRLMGRCWAYEAAERPRFAEVADALKEMLDRQDSGFGSSA